MTKPLSVEECLGHGPLLPLKANVHELRLVLGLGGLNFDLDLENSTWTWTGKERPESGHEGVICLWSTTEI